MATYGNTGGSGLSINVYSGSGGNLNEWALDYDGLKLLTIPEVITASNITTNQTVTVTLKAKPIFNNISVSFFRVKLPDGSIAEYPAINNTAIFTTPIAGALGSQQTLLVYARDNSGNRSAVASHLYTVVNSLPPSTSAITHNIPSSFSAGDVKQIQISGAVDPEGDPYTYSLILPPEITASKISGIANNETVTLTVQNTIDNTRMDNIIIRVTDINGAQDDKILDITMLSGGSSGGTNNFNVRTSFPSSVYPNEIFTAKIWELGTNNYTFSLNLPAGLTASKSTGILSNEVITYTVAPSVMPNSTLSVDVVVYTGSVSVGSFVVNMLVDGVTGEMSYTTPGAYEFTVPNSVDSISMLQVYSNKINTVSNDKGGFLLKNLAKDNILTNSTFNWPTMPEGDYLYQMNNMIYCIQGYTVTYTLDNFDTVLTATLPGNEGGVAHRHLSAYGNGSYIVTGRVDNSPVNTYLSVNNGLTWSRVETASFTGTTSHANLDYFNSVFYIVKSEANGGNLVSIDGGYNFIDKPLPTAYRNCTKPVGGVKVTKDGYFRLMHNLQGDNKLHLIKTTDRCDTWEEVPITNTSNEDSNAFLHYVNEKYFIISQRSDNLVMWVSSDLLNWETKYISKGSMGAADPTYTYDASVIGTEFFYNNDSYYISYILKTKNLTSVLYKRINVELNTVNSCLLLKNNPNGIAIYDGVFFSLLDSRYAPPSESNVKITQGIYLAGDRDTYNHDYLSTYDSFGPVNQDVEFFICNNELVCYSDKVFGDSSYYAYVPPAPPPPPPPPPPASPPPPPPPASPPPPPPQTWRLIHQGYYGALSRIPSVFGDTTDIYLDTYYPDPYGELLFGGRYRRERVLLSFDPWVTEGNIAVARFDMPRDRGDELFPADGTLYPTQSRVSVVYAYD